MPAPAGERKHDREPRIADTRLTESDTLVGLLTQTLRTDLPGCLSGFDVRFLVASTARLRHAPQAGGDFVQVGIGGGDPDDEFVDVVVGPA